MFHPPPNRLARENDWHQQAGWDRDSLLQAAREEPQAAPKQAQVTALLPVPSFQPTIASGTDPEIDPPQLGHARGNE
ncbi:MAG: hypothetical protein M3380_20510 [Chloroflexota bacterium]|nr:hypothetical protein [Chloroflexota bacterium]